MTAVWRLRLWDNAAVQNAMLRAGRIGMGRDEIGDLSSRPSDAEIASTLRQSLPDRAEGAIRIFVGYWRCFLDRMQPGDLVLAPLVGDRFAVARVEGSYEYSLHEPIEELRHSRRVDWLTPPVDREVLSAELLKRVRAPGTIGLVRVDDAASQIERIVQDYAR